MLKRIDKQEMLCCSLISKYSFNEVEDVIKEACEHQLAADLKDHKRLIKELNEDWKATLKVASNKKLSDILLEEVNNVKKD